MDVTSLRVVEALGPLHFGLKFATLTRPSACHAQVRAEERVTRGSGGWSNYCAITHPVRPRIVGAGCDGSTGDIRCPDAACATPRSSVAFGSARNVARRSFVATV